VGRVWYLSGPEVSYPSGVMIQPPLNPVLHAYLLGRVGFADLLTLQRRLAYEVAGDRAHAALILCEHPHTVSIGREGSRAHILYEAGELDTLGWPVRWVNRGGGTVLHAPGQLAVYPVVALDALGLHPRGYLNLLNETLTAIVTSLHLTGVSCDDIGVRVGGRLVSEVGVAVRDWVSYFGAVLNIHPDLEPFRHVRCGGLGEPPMTSLERELRAPVRMGTVRQRLVEEFAARFGCARVSLFHHHPALKARTERDATAAPHC
jgi:lipoyl(octanoyl) transferase